MLAVSSSAARVANVDPRLERPPVKMRIFARPVERKRDTAEVGGVEHSGAADRSLEPPLHLRADVAPQRRISLQAAFTIGKGGTSAISSVQRLPDEWEDSVTELTDQFRASQRYQSPALPPGVMTYAYYDDKVVSVDVPDGAITFPGEKAFHLYETFGLPLDFMVDAARDAHIDFDMDGFERAKESEQARARASWKGGSQKTASPAFRDLPKTVFEGYGSLTSTNCEVLAIVKGGLGVPAAKAGDEVEVVLDHLRHRPAQIVRSVSTILIGRHLEPFLRGL